MITILTFNFGIYMSYELAPGGGAWTVDEALAAARCTLVRSASASRVERQAAGAGLRSAKRTTRITWFMQNRKR